MDDAAPHVLLRPALLAAGYVDSELQRGRRSGELVVLRRGAYLAADRDPGGKPEARHALLVAAEVERIAASSVVSHVSAAVLHGLPVWDVPLGRVHVTRARPSGARVGPSVHLHPAPLTTSEISRIGRTPVTCPARTIVDLARTSSFESAVVAADAALRKRLVTAAELAEALGRAVGWPGIPAARRVVAFADGRAESVGESRSRVALLRAGFPPPTPQWEAWQCGVLLGRVDFAWPEQRTVAEFDGRIKYCRLLRPGQDPGEVVFEEKVREDALRAAGLRVVRWVWRDLADFTRAADRLRTALTPPT